MNSTYYYFFTLFLFFCSSVYSQILILETDIIDDGTFHAQHVKALACDGRLTDHCHLVWATDFVYEDYLRFLPLIPDQQVVNMSLGFQRPVDRVLDDYADPRMSFNERMRIFDDQERTFKEMINDHLDQLFVAAAGNGYRMGAITTRGVPISNLFEFYPSMYQKKNLVKVAAIEGDALDLKNLEETKLADYSNYSLEYVELAAPTARDDNGVLLQGTSFAAPRVSRISSTIRRENPNLSPEQVIELMIKSSFIVNIDRALEISRDFNEREDQSLYGRLGQALHRQVRADLRAQIGDIILVKSGGPLVEEVALTCSRFVKTTDMSIEESCLLAQEKVLNLTSERREKVKELWRLRGL